MLFLNLLKKSKMRTILTTLNFNMTSKMSPCKKNMKNLNNKTYSN